MLRGYGPNLATTNATINEIQNIYTFKPSQRVADYGAGNGNVLWRLKELPVSLTGIEINPFLYLYLKIRFLPFKNVKIIKRDFLNINTNDFDVIIVYGVPEIMNKLESKLIIEKPKSLTIISNKFSFKNIAETENLGSLHLYQI